MSYQTGVQLEMTIRFAVVHVTFARVLKLFDSISQNNQYVLHQDADGGFEIELGRSS